VARGLLRSQRRSGFERAKGRAMGWRGRPTGGAGGVPGGVPGWCACHTSDMEHVAESRLTAAHVITP